MLIFVACLCAAGLLLSFVARYPALLIVIAAMATLTVATDLQGWTSVARPASLLVTLLVEVVAVQVGYAVGVLGRSALGAWRPERAAPPEPSPEIKVGRPNGA